MLCGKPCKCGAVREGATQGSNRGLVLTFRLLFSNRRARRHDRYFDDIGLP